MLRPHSKYNEIIESGEKLGIERPGTITVQPIQHSDNFHFIERRIRECLNILAGRIMPWQVQEWNKFRIYESNFYIACFVDEEDDPAAIYRPFETLLDPLISRVNSRELFVERKSFEEGIKKKKERKRKGYFERRRKEKAEKRERKKIMIIKEGGSERALAYLRGCKMESVYGRN